MSLNTYKKNTQEWLRDRMAAYWWSPSNLTVSERICQKIPKSKSAMLVAWWPRRHQSVISVKGASAKYCVKCLNTHGINVIFQLLLSANIEKCLFWFCHYGFLIVYWWGTKLALDSSITKCEKSKEVWRLCQCTLLLLGITTYYCKFPLALNQIFPVMLMDKPRVQASLCSLHPF